MIYLEQTHISVKTGFHFSSKLRVDRVENALKILHERRGKPALCAFVFANGGDNRRNVDMFFNIITSFLCNHNRSTNFNYIIILLI